MTKKQLFTKRRLHKQPPKKRKSILTTPEKNLYNSVFIIKDGIASKIKRKTIKENTNSKWEFGKFSCLDNCTQTEDYSDNWMDLNQDIDEIYEKNTIYSDSEDLISNNAKIPQAMKNQNEIKFWKNNFNLHGVNLHTH